MGTTGTTWAYGVTSVGSRVDNLLLKTLASLEKAGFDDPFLFIDCAEDVPDYLRKYDYTTYCPPLLTYGNWVVAAWSIYIRNPHADRYAIFQDDFVTYKNLREYLERRFVPGEGYANLYTFPMNERGQGWHMSNQRGLGAVALVFKNEDFRRLLSNSHMIDRVQNPKRGKKAVDGGVVETFKKMGKFEWVHSPTLVQHTGDRSSMGNRQHPKAKSFRGEDFDALHLLRGK